MGSKSAGRESKWGVKEPEVARVRLKDEQQVQMKMWIISYELIQDSEGSVFNLRLNSPSSPFLIPPREVFIHNNYLMERQNSNFCKYNKEPPLAWTALQRQ